MTLRVSFELSNSDLRHFRQLMREARRLAKDVDEETVIAAAENLLVTVRARDVSDFVSHRLDSLETMIEMLDDEDWQIPAKERKRVVSALTYFAEEEDLIPDHIPVLGFLDDAIMIELVVRELKNELEAYADFCRFRDEERRKPKSQVPDDQREARLTRRRKALHERMRRRNSRRRRARRGSGPKLSLF